MSLLITQESFGTKGLEISTPMTTRTEGIRLARTLIRTLSIFSNLFERHGDFRRGSVSEAVVGCLAIKLVGL